MKKLTSRTPLPQCVMVLSSVRSYKVSKVRRRGARGDFSSGDEDGDEGSDEEDEEGDALLRDSAALKGGRGGVLEPGYLNIVRRVRMPSACSCAFVLTFMCVCA